METSSCVCREAVRNAGDIEAPLEGELESGGLGNKDTTGGGDNSSEGKSICDTSEAGSSSFVGEAEFGASEGAGVGSGFTGSDSGSIKDVYDRTEGALRRKL